MFRWGVPLCEVMGLRHIIDHDASITCGNASVWQHVHKRSLLGVSKERSQYFGTRCCIHMLTVQLCLFFGMEMCCIYIFRIYFKCSKCYFESRVNL